jgi:hypothetical protein
VGGFSTFPPVKVTISVDDQTSAALAAATAKVQAFKLQGAGAGEALSYSMREARESAMLAGEEIGVRMPRALTTIIGHSQILGPLMRAIFPVVAAIGFVSVLGEMVTKVQAWLHAGEESRKAWSEITTSFEDMLVKGTHAITDLRAHLVELNEGPIAALAFKLHNISEDFDALQFAGAIKGEIDKVRAQLAKDTPWFSVDSNTVRQQADDFFSKFNAALRTSGRAGAFQALTEEILKVREADIPHAAGVAALTTGYQDYLLALNELNKALNQNFDLTMKQKQVLEADKVKAEAEAYKKKADEAKRLAKELEAILQAAEKLAGFSPESINRFFAAIRNIQPTLAPGAPKFVFGSFEEWSKAMQQYTSAYGFIVEKGKQTSALQDVLNQSVTRSFDSMFQDIILGTRSMSQAFASMAASIAASVAQAIIKMLFMNTVLKGLNSLLGVFGLAGPQFQTIGPGPIPLFGGGHAAGGPVMPNMAYLVGERGPELFVPQSSGSIIPNGRGTTVINEIHVINQSAHPVSASVGQTRLDGRKFVTQIVLDDLQQYGPIRRALSGG